MAVADCTELRMPEAVTSERTHEHPHAYRPSNGTEGEMFQSWWCGRCSEDHENHGPDGVVGPGCLILARSIAGEYPPELHRLARYWDHARCGSPASEVVCTMFTGCTECEDVARDSRLNR